MHVNRHYRKFRHLAAWGVTLAWGINLLLLGGLATWIYLDGRLAHAISPFLLEQQSTFTGQTSPINVAAELLPVVATLRWGLVVACATLLIMLAGLWMGGPRARSLRAWLLTTATICGWLGLYLTWSEVAWRGQQFRLTRQLEKLEPLREQISCRWPPLDGEVPELGAYLAYPQQAPATLLLMRHARFPETSVEFSAIDRTPDGVVRFQLAGLDRGVWLEWRPLPSAPTSFLNGVATFYHVERYEELHPHWYLVRYQPSLAAPTAR